MFQKALSDSQRENTSVRALQAITRPQVTQYGKNIMVNREVLFLNSFSTL